MKSPKLSLSPTSNLENKDSENSDTIQNILKKEEQNSNPQENVTISVKSEDEKTSNESGPETKNIYIVYEEDSLSNPNSDKLSEDKENIRASQKILGKKRKSHHNLSISNKEKYSSNSTRKMKSQGNTPTKNMKENIFNANSELNFCYNELEKIVENYSFFEVSKLILKVANGMTEDNDDNHELYQKLKNISSYIKNKGNLALICLSVLSSKIQFKKAKKGKNKIKKQIHFKKEKGESVISKTVKSNKKQKYIFGDHYYKLDNNIYCYRNKSSRPSYKIALYCEKRHTKQCKAKVIVNNDSNNISVFGEHNHEGISEDRFYIRFPEFKDKNWNHIQLIKNDDNEDEIIYDN